MANYLESNLRYLRKQKGKTQAQVSKELKLGERVLSHYENGERDLNNGLLSDFASYYEVPIDALLHENLVAEKDMSRLVQLQNKYLRNDMMSLIKNSEIWKKYQEKTEVREKLLAEHKDDEAWITGYYLEQQADQMERIEAAQAEYDLSGLEELLTEGSYYALGSLLYLLATYAQYESDATNEYDYTFDLVEKLLVYGTIAYSSIKAEFERMEI